MTKIKRILHSRIIIGLLVVIALSTCLMASILSSSASSDGIENIEIRVGDSIGIIIYTQQPYHQNNTLLAEINGRQTLLHSINNEGFSAYAFNDIYPHEIHKNINLTLLDNGTTPRPTRIITVQQLLLDILATKGNSTEEVQRREFACALLNYGETTREYRNENVPIEEVDYISILEGVDSDIYPSYQQLSTDVPTSNNTIGAPPSAARIASIGIAYTNYNNYVVTVCIPRTDLALLNTYTLMVDGETYQITSNHITDKYNNKPDANPTRYVYLEIPSKNIPAQSLQQLIKIDLLREGKIVHRTQYSLLDYANELKQTQGESSAAYRYACALYYYGEAVKAAYTDIVVAVEQTIDSYEIETYAGSKIDLTENLANTYKIYYLSGKIVTLTSQTIGYQPFMLFEPVDNITDATYSKTTTTVGTLTDSSGNIYTTPTGRNFQITTQVTLLNPIKDLTEWTTPIYRPISYKSNFTPFAGHAEFTAGLVQLQYANGFKVECEPTSYSTVSLPERTNATLIDIQVTYDPKQNSYETDNARKGPSYSKTIHMAYINPIANIEYYGGSVTFSQGANATPTGFRISPRLRTGESLLLDEDCPVYNGLTSYDISGVSMACTNVHSNYNGIKEYFVGSDDDFVAYAEFCIDYENDFTVFEDGEEVAIGINPIGNRYEQGIQNIEVYNPPVSIDLDPAVGINPTIKAMSTETGTIVSFQSTVHLGNGKSFVIHGEAFDGATVTDIMYDIKGVYYPGLPSSNSYIRVWGFRLATSDENAQKNAGTLTWEQISELRRTFDTKDCQTRSVTVCIDYVSGDNKLILTNFARISDEGAGVVNNDAKQWAQQKTGISQNSFTMVKSGTICSVDVTPYISYMHIEPRYAASVTGTRKAETLASDMSVTWGVATYSNGVRGLLLSSYDSGVGDLNMKEDIIVYPKNIWYTINGTQYQDNVNNLRTIYIPTSADTSMSHDEFYAYSTGSTKATVTLKLNNPYNPWGNTTFTTKVYRLTSTTTDSNMDSVI